MLVGGALFHRFSRKLNVLGSSRAVAKLGINSAISQTLLIAVAPILTRIYSPADLGTLAAFTALTAVLSLIAMGAYAQAVVLPREDTSAVSLAIFSLLLAAVMSTVCLVAVLVALLMPGSPLAGLTWLLWLPLAVFLGAANAVLVAFANRQQRYGLMGTSRVVQSAAQAIGQVGVGIVVPSAGSLVGASTVASVAGNLRLALNLFRHAHTEAISRARMFEIAREYVAFPRHTLPGGLLSQVQFAGLPLIVGTLFGASTLGLWSLAQRVISMPLTIIGSAVGDVYYRRAVDVRNDPKVALHLHRKVLARLALLSLPPFILLALFAPSMFALAFGSEWEVAGEYARIMIPLLWVRFLSNPLSRTTLVYGRNRMGLWIQLSLAGAILLPTLLAWLAGWDFTVFLIFFTWIAAVVYVGALIIYARIIIDDPLAD